MVITDVVITDIVITDIVLADTVITDIVITDTVSSAKPYIQAQCDEMQSTRDRHVITRRFR